VQEYSKSNLFVVLGPVLEDRVNKNGKVKLVKLNVDDYSHFVEEHFPKHPISVVPTVLGIKEGKAVSSFKGNLDAGKVVYNLLIYRLISSLIHYWEQNKPFNLIFLQSFLRLLVENVPPIKMSRPWNILFSRQ
jgi:hypothetical protein